LKRVTFIISFIVIVLSGTNAQSRWSFELNGGEVYNFPSPLIISQQGYPNIKLWARYSTEALTLPVYWDICLGRWDNAKLWEFEVIHHKLYLDNITSDVQKFNISHGFNMLMMNRGFAKKTFRYRAGAGIVLAHPESTIRGKEFGDSTDDFDLGYYISGPAFNLAVSRPFYLGKRFYINMEAKTTVAYSYIKVAQGHADVYSFAFHIILGFGFDFIKSGKEK
jgi:hypothetical protein